MAVQVLRLNLDIADGMFREKTGATGILIDMDDPRRNLYFDTPLTKDEESQMDRLLARICKRIESRKWKEMPHRPDAKYATPAEMQPVDQC